MYQVTKRYIDLTIDPQLSWNQLSSVEIEGVKFAEFSNPHSAFYCLSRKQMKQWIKSGRIFKNQVVNVGALESAATFCLWECFSIYKPHPSNLNYFEVRHYDSKYSKLYPEPESPYTRQRLIKVPTYQSSRIRERDLSRSPVDLRFEIYSTDESGILNLGLKFWRFTTPVGNLYPFIGVANTKFSNYTCNYKINYEYMSSVKRLAIKGIFWTIAGDGITFGSHLTLTRLLGPELFHLVSLPYLLIAVVNAFSDIGLKLSIIQNQRGENPEFLNTAWTMQVIRSFFIGLCVILVTLPVANFYKEPGLLWLIPVLGINTIIGGFNSTATSSLERKMAVKKVVIFELGIQIVSTTVMIVWVWFDRSIGAIIAGNLTGALMQLVWSHFLIPGKSNHFAWDREAAKEIFSYGKWIFLSSALFFLYSEADRLILGKLFERKLLALYGAAFRLSDMPRYAFMGLGRKVIIPSISILAADLPSEELRPKILKNRNLILIPLAIALAIFVSCSDQLILILYGEEYVKYSWMIPILALGIWHRTLHNLMGSCLLALGKSQYPAMGNLLTIVNLCIGIPLGYHLKGNLGALIAVAVSDIPTYVVITYGLWREKLSCFWQDIQLTVLFVGVLAAIILCRYALGGGLPIDKLSAADMIPINSLFQ